MTSPPASAPVHASGLPGSPEPGSPADLLRSELGPLPRAIAIMALLRSPAGCPWDREQTFDTIKRHTLEETYEVFDAIERRSWTDLKDELGDLLLQILFYAQMAQEAGHFTIEDIADNLNRKLIRRHPHIFAGAEAADAGAVLRNWEQIKQREKDAHAPAAKPESLLADIPRSMPAMLEASKLGSRAAKVGFDWPDVSGVMDKLQEEIREIEAELPGAAREETLGGAAAATECRSALEEELGDLLFTTVNLARHVRVDPETALRGANSKFRRRFAAMEASAGDAGDLSSATPEQLDERWRAAKLAATMESRRVSTP